MKKILLLATTFTLALQAQTFNVASTTELRTALTNSASNGEADTIILADGTYKTTDDSFGTFAFLDNESYSLTLKGSSKDKVILSGDHVSQIFNFNTTTNNAELIVENITFSDANNTKYDSNGGAIFTDATLKVVSCDFTNNSATSYGGGFYASSATITNTTFTNNSATSHGGGFFASSATITDTTFTNNSATSGGGGFRADYATITDATFTNNSASSGGGFYTDSYYNSATITNTTFTGNSASNGSGGGFFASSSATISASIFTGNSATNNGGGFYGRGTLSNSILRDNNASVGGGIYANGNLNATNNLLTNNTNGIYLSSGETNNIYNTIFLNNSGEDISGGSNIIVSLKNNYLDTWINA